ncbi:DUF2634 domain-containing protein [Bombilactobacillus bombi]|nr:DUF2634 domain-containing protein [Bombilactobacillus bombi]
MTNTTLTFAVKNNRIINKIDQHEAMVQAVDKILRTERFVYPIYSNQYGNDFNELFGKNFSYAKVEVERMVTEALLADQRILNVKVESIEQIDQTILQVAGSCASVYGLIPIQSKVRINEPK